MLLFCLGIEPILRYLDLNKIDFICYADDIIIKLKDEMSIQDTLINMYNVYNTIGLTINIDKCQNTLNG